MSGILPDLPDEPMSMERMLADLCDRRGTEIRLTWWKTSIDGRVIWRAGWDMQWPDRHERVWVEGPSPREAIEMLWRKVPWKDPKEGRE